MEQIRSNLKCVDLISDTYRQLQCRGKRFLPARREVGDEVVDGVQRMIEQILGVVDISFFCFLGLVFVFYLF
jgi:hypothetical protein